jgi:hypothetical protein
MRLHVLLFTSVCIAVTSLAAPPERIAAELLTSRPLRIAYHNRDLPQPLISALGKLFREAKVELAEPGSPIQGEFVINGHGRRLPSRRFILGFETTKLYCIYIERGAPAICAYAIIFEKISSGQFRFVWAGADLEPPFAHTVDALKRRITNHDLLDHDPKIW